MHVQLAGMGTYFVDRWVECEIVDLHEVCFDVLILVVMASDLANCKTVTVTFPSPTDIPCQIRCPVVVLVEADWNALNS